MNDVRLPVRLAADYVIAEGVSVVIAARRFSVRCDMISDELRRRGQESKPAELQIRAGDVMRLADQEWLVVGVCGDCLIMRHIVWGHLCEYIWDRKLRPRRRVADWRPLAERLARKDRIS